MESQYTELTSNKVESIMKKIIYIICTISSSVLFGWIGYLFGQTGAYVGAFIGIIAGFYASSEMVKNHISRKHPSSLRTQDLINPKLPSWQELIKLNPHIILEIIGYFTTRFKSFIKDIGYHF